MLTTELLYLAIAVSDIDLAAKKLAQNGFTLKKPHTYTSGVQEGLVTQSTFFKDGTSLQLVSPKKKEGALSQWLKQLLKNGDGGYQIVLHSQDIKSIERNLKKTLPSRSFRLQSYPRYDWLSFKTDSPYQHLVLMKWRSPPNFTSKLFDHQNKVYGIKRVMIRPFGDTATWAKIIKETRANELPFDFTTPLSSGHAFIAKIQLYTKKVPPPKPFKLGDTTVEFHTL